MDICFGQFQRVPFYQRSAVNTAAISTRGNPAGETHRSSSHLQLAPVHIHFPRQSYIAPCWWVKKKIGTYKSSAAKFPAFYCIAFAGTSLQTRVQTAAPAVLFVRRAAAWIFNWNSIK
jgi:hypothetical protein